MEFAASTHKSSATYPSGSRPHAPCEVNELPQHVSDMHAGDNMQIHYRGIITDANTISSEAYGLLLVWTTYAAADDTWKRLRSSFLGRTLFNAIAVSARKHKNDWWIDEAKRPFGDCRFTVFIPHTDSKVVLQQAADSLAQLLAGLPTSHVFYVTNADVASMWEPSVPSAARLTQPIHSSSTHTLVYSQPQANGRYQHPNARNQSKGGW